MAESATTVDVLKLLHERVGALRILLPYRAAIDAAADCKAFLPEPTVLRAMCCYISGDFHLFIDGCLRSSAGKAVLVLDEQERGAVTAAVKLFEHTPGEGPYIEALRRVAARLAAWGE